MLPNKQSHLAKGKINTNKPAEAKYYKLFPRCSGESRNVLLEEERETEHMKGKAALHASAFFSLL